MELQTLKNCVMIRFSLGLNQHFTAYAEEHYSPRQLRLQVQRIAPNAVFHSMEFALAFPSDFLRKHLFTGRVYQALKRKNKAA